jgi:hypothetical protein
VQTSLSRWAISGLWTRRRDKRRFQTLWTYVHLPLGATSANFDHADPALWYHGGTQGQARYYSRFAKKGMRKMGRFHWYEMGPAD